MIIIIYKDVKMMSKMKRCLKRFSNWYFNQYIEFYRPMIENNVPIVF